MRLLRYLSLLLLEILQGESGAITIIHNTLEQIPITRTKAKLFPNFPEMKVKAWNFEVQMPTTESHEGGSLVWTVEDDVILFGIQIAMDSHGGDNEVINGFGSSLLRVNDKGIARVEMAVNDHKQAVGIPNKLSLNHYIPLHVPLEEDDYVDIYLSAENASGLGTLWMAVWAQLYCTEKR